MNLISDGTNVLPISIRKEWNWVHIPISKGSIGDFSLDALVAGLSALIHPYAAVLAVFFIGFRTIRKARYGSLEKCALFLLLCSIIPNNMIAIILSWILVGIFTLTNIQNWRLQRILPVILIMVYVVFMQYIFEVYLLNCILCFMYGIFFFIGFFTVNGLVFDPNYMHDVEYSLKRIVIIQIICQGLQFLNCFKGRFEDIVDNIYGTFGSNHSHDCAVLLCLMIVLIYVSVEKPIWKRVYWILVLLPPLMLTSALAVIVSFAISFVMFLLMDSIAFRRINFKIMLTTCLLIVAFVFAFEKLSPSWVIDLVTGLTNAKTYERFHKIESYGNVFWVIPRQSISFLLFGNGPANFSSRAALTATGEYGDNFKPNSSSFFDKTYASELTIKYILPTFNKSYIKLGVNDGTINFPFSSVISYMGEFGLVGIIVFIGILLSIIRRYLRVKSFLGILFVGVILGLALSENYLDNTKVVYFLMFFSAFIAAKMRANTSKMLLKGNV